MEESFSKGEMELANAGGGPERLGKHVDRLIDLMGALARAKTRLFDLYALIMKDGE